MSDLNVGRIDVNDTMVLFADLQLGIADLPLTISGQQLGKSVRALAKLAKTFGLPTVVTAVPGGDGSAPQLLPELTEVLGNTKVFLRSTPDSFQDDAIASAIASTGRKTILVSGVASEVAVGLPTLTGAHLGYSMFVVTDACGGVSVRSEQAMFARIAQAGATTTSIPTLCGELAGDFREPLGQAAIGILFEMASGGS